MNLFLVTQTSNRSVGAYDSMVVVAGTEDDARAMSPSSMYRWVDGDWRFVKMDGGFGVPDKSAFGPTGFWCDPSKCKVTLLGVAEPGLEEGVVCASFIAK